MKFIQFIAIAATAAGLAACHRQPALRVVYVPAPPPAPSPAAGQGRVLVIQKPAPALPAVTAPKLQEQPPEHIEQAATPPAPPVEHKEVAAPASPTAKPPAGDAPQLEPLRSVQQQAALERQIKTLQGGLQRRMAKLSQRSLSAVDQKTLADARTLLVQSNDAMKNGDFLQSLNLAKKADLLVAAVENQQ